jgi:uncharacterized protein
MKIILDTNVVVSASLLAHSVSFKAWSKAKFSGKIISSDRVFIELVDTLIRSKFDKYVTLESRKEFISEYRKLCDFIEITHTVSICRDPKDNKYLELALSGKADCIVTGDKGLLILHPFENIPIITPRDFIENY